MATHITTSKNNNNKPTKPFLYAIMEQKSDALERLEIYFRWGHYGFRVLRFHLTSFPPGRIIGFHKHSEYEFHFIPRGKGSVILEDKHYALQEGMFYLTGPNVMHLQEADALEAMDELCLHIDIYELNDNEKVKSSFGLEMERSWEIQEAEACVQGLRDMPLRPVIDQYHAMNCFLTAYRAWQDHQPGLFTTLKQSVIQILLRSVRVHQGDQLPLSLPPRDMNTYRFQLAAQFIQDNYAYSISLDDVAEKIHISGRQLQRIFREQSSLSFSEYVEKIRLTGVCTELLNSTETIEQIVMKHGFTNSNYFYYVFRKRFQMTPSQYKQQHQLD